MSTDELYNKMNWEIPKSNNFISDSESPLCLLSSPTPTMPSPTLAPVMVPMPSYNNSCQEDDIPCLSHNDRRGTTSSEVNNSTANIGSRRTMYQEHIIACNNSISCIRPQSISIKWLTTSTTSDDDHGKVNNSNKRQAGGESSILKDKYQSSNNEESSSSTTEEEDATTSTTENSHSSTIKIIFSNRNKRSVNDVQEEDNAATDTYQQEDDDLGSSNSYLADQEEEDSNLNNEESDYSLSSLSKKNGKYNKQKTSTSNKKQRKQVVSTTLSDTGSSRKHKGLIMKKVVSKPTIPTPLMTNYTKSKQKRTVTSYDLQTSEYLKSVFFEIYSMQPKLTKEQRAKVQKKTGLPSRNITYWFSNHKRRFQDTLKVYRKIVSESEGTIKNYQDFLQWRKEHELPENVTQEEVAKCEAKEEEVN